MNGGLAGVIAFLQERSLCVGLFYNPHNCSHCFNSTTCACDRSRLGNTGCRF